MSRAAFIYYTHYVSEVVLREIRRLSVELPANYDLWVIGRADAPRLFEQLNIPRAATCVYSLDDLQTLPYPGKIAELIQNPANSSNELPLMRYFRDRPDYAHYWLCEYDVRYTGSWTELLRELDTANVDLLCAHLATYTEVPDWGHWASLQRPGEPIPDAAKLRGFMPFCRLSQRLLGKINDHYITGLRGLYEATWPTIASLEGLSVEEIGGGSRFAPPSRAKRFYHSTYFSNGLFLSTFAPWPVYDESSRVEIHVRDTLWHPVKEAMPTAARPQISAAPVAAAPGKAGPDKKFALVAIVKNEARYLIEWLAYYQALGVRHFVIFNNDSNDATQDILECFAGLVDLEVIKWPGYDDRSPQVTAYNHFLEKYRDKFEFAAFFDSDEFLVPMPGIQFEEFLNEIPDKVDAIGFNQRVFGSGGNRYYRPDLVLRRFRSCAKSDYDENRYVKSLYRLSRLKEISNVHASPTTGGFHARPNFAKLTIDADRPGVADQIDFSKFQLNHYILKSYEEFQHKRFRGGADANTLERRLARYSEDFFRGREPGLNTTTSVAADSWVPRVVENIRAFREECRKQGHNDFSAAFYGELNLAQFCDEPAA